MRALEHPTEKKSLTITIDDIHSEENYSAIRDAIRQLSHASHNLTEREIYLRIGQYFDKNPDVLSIKFRSEQQSVYDDEGTYSTAFHVKAEVTLLDGSPGKIRDDDFLDEDFKELLEDLHDDGRNPSWSAVLGEYRVDSELMWPYSARARAIGSRAALEAASRAHSGAAATTKPRTP